MEDVNKQRELYEIAQKRFNEIKGFYIHLTVYILVNIFILFKRINFFEFDGIDVQLSDFNLFFFWGIGLAAHWASVFGSNLFFGKNWEEKKIKEILENEKKQKRQWE